MMHEIAVGLIWFLTIAATVAIWIRVLKRPGSIGLKILYLVISAIPFIGPIMYWFVDPPPVLPESEQGKKIPKGTEVYPSFKPLIDALQKPLKSKKK